MNLRWWFTFFFVVATAFPLERAGAAEFEVRVRETTAGTFVDIFMTGAVGFGDYEKFAAILRGNRQADSIVLHLTSPGGDAEEAMRIGRLVRAAMVSTSAAHRYHDGPRTFSSGSDGKCPSQRECICASACFLVWAGGYFRSGNLLGLHRPTFAAERFARMNASEAQRQYQRAVSIIRAYLIEQDVPTRYFETMMSVPSTSLVLVNESEFDRDLYGFIPWIREWIAAACNGKQNDAAQFTCVVEKTTQAGRDARSKLIFR